MAAATSANVCVNHRGQKLRSAGGRPGLLLWAPFVRLHPPNLQHQKRGAQSLGMAPTAPFESVLALFAMLTLRRRTEPMVGTHGRKSDEFEQLGISLSCPKLERRSHFMNICEQTSLHTSSCNYSVYWVCLSIFGSVSTGMDSHPCKEQFCLECSSRGRCIENACVCDPG